MERYNIQKDFRLLSITKRWTVYAGKMFYGLPALLPLLFTLTGGRGRHPTPLVPLPVLLALPLAWVILCGSYVLWKVARGGDTYVFDARKHLFERNGHVISHWDGIAQVMILDVPHRRDRRRRWLLELLEQDPYYYTYRLLVLLSNGKKHVVDECSDKQTIMQLAEDIASYTNKPITNDVANVGWLG